MTLCWICCGLPEQAFTTMSLWLYCNWWTVTSTSCKNNQKPLRFQSCCYMSLLMLTNLACSISGLKRGHGATLRCWEYAIDRLGGMGQKAEKMLPKKINEWLPNVQLFPRVWILKISSLYVCGSRLKAFFGYPCCKHNILPDIQLANRIVIISATYHNSYPVLASVVYRSDPEPGFKVWRSKMNVYGAVFLFLLHV